MHEVFVGDIWTTVGNKVVVITGITFIFDCDEPVYVTYPKIFRLPIAANQLGTLIAR